MKIEEMALHIQDRYNSLVIDGKFFPVTPQELAAIITRINDGTISHTSGKIVMDELAKRNMAFIKFVHELVGHATTEARSST